MVRKVKVRHPGSLRRYGYNLHESQPARRRALAKADRRYGRGKVDQKLDALNRFNSHHSTNREKVRQDLIWNEMHVRNGRHEEVVWVEPYTRSDGTRVKGYDRIVRR
nr:hypothetical protein [Ferrimicrobium acidiphilum]